MKWILKAKQFIFALLGRTPTETLSIGVTIPLPTFHKEPKMPPEMRDMVLDRFIFTDESTIGKISFDGVQVCYSLELSCRKGDEKNLMAVEPGRYEIKFTFSPRFNKETLEVTNVPGRTGIRVHAANKPSELDGCIAPGMRVNELLLGTHNHFLPNGELSVFDSIKALEIVEKEVRTRLEKGPLFITIHGGGRNTKKENEWV